ncbi:hypothetical protein BH18ACT3_BH18ACT3_10590 [soil metagenome]
MNESSERMLAGRASASDGVWRRNPHGDAP